MSKKKSYEPNFKAKVALECIKNTKSIAEICSEYKIPATNLHEWRDKLLSKSVELFAPESENNKHIKSLKQDIDRLHGIIGELTVENSFMKKKLMR
jgi:transposase